ncbi:hypothetical protein [Wolbachia endosymbiont (group A) of Anomoia purmunda]|uniref:hypothetical protein n=1 Tax=Wolbachia endosymbiont (group A) of Anomoia purmunda TaxID=2953978 RepID=UPI00222F564E|nr:hypothetical protein [Wolbachia endosymbiont (group A) of Anomoia purmunda]
MPKHNWSYMQNRSQCLGTGMTGERGAGLTIVIPLLVSGILDLYRDDGCRLAINIKKFTKRKKGKRSPVMLVLTLYYCKWRCNNVLTLKLSAIWLNVEKI